MTALEQLADLCQCEVHVSVNPHKSTYETIEGYLKVQDEDIDPWRLSEMIRRDRLVWVQAYPLTPIGFYVVYHFDIEQAILEVIDAVKYIKLQTDPTEEESPDQ